MILTRQVGKETHISSTNKIHIRLALEDEERQHFSKWKMENFFQLNLPLPLKKNQIDMR